MKDAFQMIQQAAHLVPRVLYRSYAAHLDAARGVFPDGSCSGPSSFGMSQSWVIPLLAEDDDFRSESKAPLQPVRGDIR